MRGYLVIVVAVPQSRQQPLGDVDDGINEDAKWARDMIGMHRRWPQLNERKSASQSRGALLEPTQCTSSRP
jgi:hypothetical protein